MALSTVPAGVATEALGYLREGGPENLRELARFLSDTVFLTGEGFDPPHPMPAYGIHQLPGSPPPAPGRGSGPWWPSCSTARTNCPGTPPSSTPSAPPWPNTAPLRSPSSAARCVRPTPGWPPCSPRPKR